MLAVVGGALLVLAILSRLFGLTVYRHIASSDSRAVTASFLPGTPWLHLASDRHVVPVLVSFTYGSLALGIILLCAEALL